jgi:cell division protein FtsL
MLCIAIVLCAMLLTGARQAGRDLYQRPAQAERARETQRQWSTTLAGEMVGQAADSGWLEIAETAPELMLQACATGPLVTR